MEPFIPKSKHLQQSKLRQIFEKAPKDAVNLAIGQPGEDTPYFIREAASKVALEAPLGYTLNAGILPLREKLAEELPFTATADQIVLTAGVQEALFATFYLLTQEGPADILLPDPGFLTYPALTGLHHCNPRTYHLKEEDNFQFNANAVLEQIRPETRAILVAHPSNPTGSDAPYEEYHLLIEALSKRPGPPIWVIADEVYYGMSYGADCASMESFVEDYPYIILLRGASKSHHMTGWRLAWAILPEMLVKPYVAIHQYICTCASALTQYTFLAIRGSQYEKDWLSQQRNMYKKKRDLVFHELYNFITLKGGEGAYYWMLDIRPFLKEGQNDEGLCLDLIQKGLVTTAPGSAFGTESDGYLRLSYGPAIHNLELGLGRLKEYFNSLK